MNWSAFAKKISQNFFAWKNSCFNKKILSPGKKWRKFHWLAFKKQFHGISSSCLFEIFPHIKFQESTHAQYFFLFLFHSDWVSNLLSIFHNSNIHLALLKFINMIVHLIGLFFSRSFSRTLFNTFIRTWNNIKT